MPQIETFLREIIKLSNEEEQDLLLALKEIGKEVKDLTEAAGILQAIEKEIHEFEQLYIQHEMRTKKRAEITQEEFTHIKKTALHIQNELIPSLEKLYKKLRKETKLQMHTTKLMKRADKALHGITTVIRKIDPSDQRFWGRSW